MYDPLNIDFGMYQGNTNQQQAFCFVRNIVLNFVNKFLGVDI